MKFEVFPKRRAGKLLPTHFFWTGKVVGDLFVTEVNFHGLIWRSIELLSIGTGTDPGNRHCGSLYCCYVQYS